MAIREQILSEYEAVRSEIRQLNGQAFAIISGALTLNFTIIGTYYTIKSQPQFSAVSSLPLMAVLLLAAAAVLISHKIRVAHRLALYQKFFIENSLPGIKWSSVYFEYREKYSQKYSGLLDFLLERFGNAQVVVVFVAQLIDTIIIVENESEKSELLLGLSVAAIFLQYLFIKISNDYSSTLECFRSISKGE